MLGSILVESPPLRIKQCAHGLMMYNTQDIYVGRSLDQYGEYSENEVNLFNQIVRPGMTCLDVGANIGCHTVALSKLVGSQGKVLAFEPQKQIYNLLCGNIALNALDNVSTFMAGIGHASTSMNVPRLDYTRTNNFGGVSLSEALPGETVPVITLDSFNLNNCHFIKADVEGMELKVIEGSLQTINKHHPHLYIENDDPQKSLALIQKLLSLHYRLYWHTPPLFNPNNYFKNSQNIFTDIISVNMLCIHKAYDRITIKDFQEITEANADKHIAPHFKKTRT